MWRLDVTHALAVEHRLQTPSETHRAARAKKTRNES
jgi:hypothetical protein